MKKVEPKLQYMEALIDKYFLFDENMTEEEQKKKEEEQKKKDEEKKKQEEEHRQQRPRRQQQKAQNPQRLGHRVRSVMAGAGVSSSTWARMAWGV